MSITVTGKVATRESYGKALLSLGAQRKSMETFSLGGIALRKVDLADAVEIDSGIGRGFPRQ